ncbi:unnamed protein product, partial [Durusdinium trenchii]
FNRDLWPPTREGASEDDELLMGLSVVPEDELPCTAFSKDSWCRQLVASQQDVARRRAAGPHQSHEELQSGAASHKLFGSICRPINAAFLLHAIE